MNNKPFYILIIMVFLAGCWPSDDVGSTLSKDITKARKETLIITSTEAGAVKSDKPTLITNELQWSVIIKEVVEEGAVVKKDDTIVIFECKALEDAIDTKELELNRAELSLEQAKKQLVITRKQHANTLLQTKNGLLDQQENLKLYQTQSQNLLNQAKDYLSTAEETLHRYTAKGGKWENDRKDADTLIRMTTKNLKISKERLEFKKKVNADPELDSPYSASEIETDELQVEQLQNNLDKAIASKELMIKYDYPNQLRQYQENVKQAKAALDVLENFTIPQEMRRKKTEITEAELNLDKVTAGQKAELEWAVIDITGKEKELKKHQEKLTELKEDQAKLNVKAERSGLVLYDPGWKEHGVRIQVKVGEEITPRQKLMKIPDMTTLQVKTTIFEALRKYLKVKEVDGKGSMATIVLDAFPNKKIIGHVAKTSPLPKDTGPDWMKTGTKVFDLFIDVDWKAQGLIAGETLTPDMNCDVTIVLDRIENALTIPVISVYNRQNTYYCRKVVDGNPVEHEITIGKQNDSRVQVLTGLEEDDEVLLISKAPEADGKNDSKKDTSAGGKAPAKGK